MDIQIREIGFKLRAEREKAGLTQEELADILTWSQPKVSRIELGTQPVTVEEYFEIRQALKAQKIASFTIPDGRSKVPV